MKVLVTGADGFLGSNLIRHLLVAGHKVKALIHSDKDYDALSGLKVDKLKGDVLSPKSIDKAMAGIDAVFHLASLYKFYPWWQKKAGQIYKVNVQGTRNVLKAAKKNNIKRFIFTSSIASLGKQLGKKPSDETTVLNLKSRISHYARSKVLAENEVLSFVRQGLPAIILNPAALIGERDFKPTPTGQMIIDFLNHKLPVTFNGMIPLADVDDVARAHLVALDRGRVGERYILCNNRAYPLKELFYLVEQISGVSAPRLKIPYPLLMSFLYFDEVFSYFLKKRPLLSSSAARFFRRATVFDNSKAARELSYATTPITTSLEKAVNWYKENSYVQ
ncbi:MAG: SDR family oxidoreductase [Candidatus Omnitrophica bacterium]|nr:SDR family oxidoreductase [Candidatus Omnitrophota bacterium]